MGVPDEVDVLLQDGEQGLQVEHAGSHVIAAGGSSVTILWRAERRIFYFCCLVCSKKCSMTPCGAFGSDQRFFRQRCEPHFPKRKALVVTPEPRRADANQCVP